MTHTVKSVKMPKGTDMVKLNYNLSTKNFKHKSGKTANALIAAYILKLGK